MSNFLEDRFTSPSGRHLLTGPQAVARALMNQWARDQAEGLQTAGFVSGYRGSPLGSLDMALAKVSKYLDERNILVRPGVNEDLAATAVWGTQQVEQFGAPKFDGVFGLLYGKGPGIDRSGDALRHANLFGTSRNGGVVVLAGDDHTCKSSTIPHHSELALVDAGIPVLAPSDMQDLMDFMILGYRLSRGSGLWVAVKVTADIMDSTGICDVSADRVKSHVARQEVLGTPEQSVLARNTSVPAQGLAQERSYHEQRLPLVHSLSLELDLDKRTIGDPSPKVAFVGCGKSYGDIRSALALLGLTDNQLSENGVSVYKIGLIWPLSLKTIEELSQAEKILIVEEKRSIVEDQLRNALYTSSHRPIIEGKRSKEGSVLFSPVGEIGLFTIAEALLERLPSKLVKTARAKLEAAANFRKPATDGSSIASRKAYFCSGCPHNTSTQVPTGMLGLGGVGCHALALGMDRASGLTHMGAEGMNWVGAEPFTGRNHVFQNIGDGTYYHSGLLAIRAAIAAESNITFKLLYNDAVAMTGGQAVDGPLSADRIVWQLVAEGVQRVAVVAENPEAWIGVNLPKDVAISHRDELEKIQRKLSEVTGTTVLLYDQACATEKRRRRKRGIIEQPAERILINELVCEGCGDCSIQSNCLSIVPSQTAFGTKRRIDQSSCNVDASCVKGFCPSFVSVVGADPRKKSHSMVKVTEDLPEPARQLESRADILVTGIGGTGVVTVGAVLAVAAHIEGRNVSVFDVTGLAQKGGAVMSHVRIGRKDDILHRPRISEGSADVLLACDTVTAATPDALHLLAPNQTQSVSNIDEAVTAEFIVDRNAHGRMEKLVEVIDSRVGAKNNFRVNASCAASKLLGDAIGSNMLIVGAAYQRGLIPLDVASIQEAISLNGTAVEMNLKAFAIGRESVCKPEIFAERLRVLDQLESSEESFEEMLKARFTFLIEYQDRRYAQRFVYTIRNIEKAENAYAIGGVRTSDALSLTKDAMRSLFRLMSYKDEYEVARLHLAAAFENQLATQFGSYKRLEYHLAPPFLSKPDSTTGKPTKRRFGPWVRSVFWLLVRLKRLRGTPFDLFGWTEERKTERALIRRFEESLENISSALATGEVAAFETALELVRLPQEIRGFGHVKAEALAKLDHRWSMLDLSLRKFKNKNEAL